MDEGGGRQPTFVVTLQLDDASFGILQGWRKVHFPAQVNYLPAHLTLLHTISAAQVSRLRESWPLIGQAAAVVSLSFRALRFLGGGVAVEVDSAELHAVRARILDVIGGSLTRQDLQSFRPHVTIQNKVGSAMAKALHDAMSLQFEPWCGQGTGVLVWRYLGGPWASELRLSFAGDAAIAS